MAGGTLNIAEHSGELSRHCMARLETYRACYSMGHQWPRPQTSPARTGSPSSPHETKRLVVLWSPLAYQVDHRKESDRRTITHGASIGWMALYFLKICLSVWQTGIHLPEHLWIALGEKSQEALQLFSRECSGWSNKHTQKNNISPLQAGAWMSLLWPSKQ